MALTKVSRGLLTTSIVDNGNATAITIDSSENVLVGRTSSLSGQSESISSDTVMSVHGVLAQHQTNAGILQYSSNDNSFQLRSYGATAGTGIIKFLVGGGGGSADSEAMRIDASGNFMVGGTQSNPTGANVAGASIDASGEGNFSVDGAEALRVNRLTSDGAIVKFMKAGQFVGSIGSHSGDEIFFGNNSNIGMRTEQTGADRFEPCTGTGASRNNAIDLGIAGNQWRDIYCANLVESSDRRLKQDVEELSDAEQRAAVAAKSLLRKYRLISDVEDGDNRYSVGIIAQELQDAFTAEGLDAANYKMWRSDTFIDEATGQEKTQQSIVYTQLLAFIIAAI